MRSSERLATDCAFDDGELFELVADLVATRARPGVSMQCHVDVDMASPSIENALPRAVA